MTLQNRIGPLNNARFYNFLINIINMSRLEVLLEITLEKNKYHVPIVLLSYFLHPVHSLL